MKDIKTLDPSFFLLSNKGVYYTWHLPRGTRTTLSVEDKAVVLGEKRRMLVEGETPLAILGVNVTGYYIEAKDTTGDVDLFVVDTLPDMSDPYTGDVMEAEMTRVASLREFVASFNSFTSRVRITTQTLYGITLEEWGSRLQYIWANRVKRPYLIDGLVFFNRVGDDVWVWQNKNTVTTLQGERVVLGGDTSCNREPEVLAEWDLTWDDLVGHGSTVPLWYMRERFAFGSRLAYDTDVTYLTDDEKNEMKTHLLLSPRQIEKL